MAFAGPSLALDHERVIDASCAVAADNNVGEVLTNFRILQIQHSPLVGIADRGTGAIGSAGNHTTGAGQVNGWITFITKQHVNGVVADVICSDEPILSELLLQTQIPLIDVGLFHVERKDGVNAVQWKGTVFVQGNRVGISTGKARPRIIEGRTIHDSLCAFRRGVPFSAVLVQMRNIEKDPIGCTESHKTVALRVTGETHTWREMFLVV